MMARHAPRGSAGRAGRVATTALASLALATGLGGCGGGAGDESTAPPATEAPVTAGPAAPTTAGSTPPTTAAGPVTTRPANPTYVDYCRILLENAETIKALPDKDERLRRTKAMWAELATTSPAAVREDIVAVNAYVQGVTDEALIATTRMPPDVVFSTEKLRVWHKDNCGMD